MRGQGVSAACSCGCPALFALAIVKKNETCYFYVMDIEALEFRALCLQTARDFFIENNYLELDTPALAAALIPETCLEVFQTEAIQPFMPKESAKKLFLVPSPEVFIKPVIAQTKRSVFQISKCYRNGESVGRIHSPEFTMLEYYTMNADYKDSIKITESFFCFIIDKIKNHPLASPEACNFFAEGFQLLTMEDAFIRYAGFSLAEQDSVKKLAEQARRLDLASGTEFAHYGWDDLYELILVHCIEPALPKKRCVALMDYPAEVPCLAKNKAFTIQTAEGKTVTRQVKERWEVYAGGIELANCYTEERDSDTVNRYFAEEAALKEKTALVPHPSVKNFGDICAQMPPCSGVALGMDRLIALLAGRKTIDSFFYA
ncbi:tRNA ligases class II (D, K and N) [Treponema phagedenis F0421]|nr:tRNA ligases class II (D, K and N) [Treponema phagedenis F0421]